MAQLKAIERLRHVGGVETARIVIKVKEVRKELRT
jgi:hypothetical protein